jgi:hypothetical protein
MDSLTVPVCGRHSARLETRAGHALTINYES